MSDPVANAEIEDVLLSIRRLVQGDKEFAPESSPESAVPETADLDPNSDEDAGTGEAVSSASALVLTPALRVSEAAAEEMVPEGAAETEDDPDPDDAFIWQVDAENDHGAPSLENRGSIVAELESDGPDGLDDASEAFAVSEDFGKETSVGTEDDGTAADAIPSFVRAVARDVVETEVERMGRPDPQPTPWLVPGESEDDTAAAHAGNAPRAGFRFGANMDDDLKPAPSLDALPEEDDLTGSAQENQSDAKPFPETSGSQIREAFSGGFQSDASPRETTQRDDDAVLVGAEAGIPDASDGLDVAAPEGDDETQLENLFIPGGAPLDEETLRDMVADLVHRELQGELGERITRNVRKLVRREIHRALASRDFD